MIRINDYKGIDFSIDDIDNLINILKEVKEFYQNNDDWFDIREIPNSEVIIQGSDRDNIWIEDIRNIIE
jgi:hypothetical protein